MEKPGLKQLSKSKFFKRVHSGSFMSICKPNYQFIKIIQTLIKHFGLDQTQYSNTPLLRPTLPAKLFILMQLGKVAIQYDCNGAIHAQI